MAPVPAPSNDLLVMVALCTHRRNVELNRFLERLCDNIDQLPASVRLGVSVADDNDDGRAAPVVARFDRRLTGPAVYTHTGSGNISIARNASLEGALGVGADWVAMTDDDCVPRSDWIATLMEAQQTTDADIVTGSCDLAPPPGAPEWLSAQPFFESASFHYDHLESIDVAATNNSMIRADALRRDAAWRFNPSLGVLGGEDMVFFKSAAKSGMHIVYSRHSPVVGQESADRATMRYQLRSHLWLGNTEFVTSHRLGDHAGLVDTEDLTATVGGLRRTLDATASSEAARGRVIADFTWSSVTEQYETFLREIVAQRGGRRT